MPPSDGTRTPEPVKRSRLDVALWVFSLYFFPGFALRGIAGFSFQGNKTAGHSHARGHSTSLGIQEAQTSASDLTSACSVFSFFLGAPLMGTNTTSMVRPSI